MSLKNAEFSPTWFLVNIIWRKWPVCPDLGKFHQSRSADCCQITYGRPLALLSCANCTIWGVLSNLATLDSHLITHLLTFTYDQECVFKICIMQLSVIHTAFATAAQSKVLPRVCAQCISVSEHWSWGLTVYSGVCSNHSNRLCLVMSC